jgi:recombination protein RecT
MPDSEVTPKGEPQEQLPMEAEPALAAEQAAQRLAKQPRTIKELLQGPQFKKELSAVLTKTMRPERFTRVVLTTMMRVPDLALCSRESFFLALLNCASYGLEPDGRRAHLIPFKNRKNNTVECQLIIDYKGLAELVRRSGEVSYIHADVVYEKDEWSYEYGTGAHLKHKPHPEDRGAKKVAFYSYVRLKDGSEDFVVMNPVEVEKIRKRSKSPDAGPWVTDYDEMGKKTAFRRHSKWLPLSPEVREAVERDDEAVDISGWEEMLEPGNAAEALPEAKKSSLKDRLMSQKELPGEVSSQGVEG